MKQLYPLDEIGQRKLSFLYRQSGIEERYSCLADFGNTPMDDTFFPLLTDKRPFPSTEARMQKYREVAANLSMEAITNATGDGVTKNDITHLISVSCTGMHAPGLDLELMRRLELPNLVFRTSVNFMGCYAALHALRLADALIAKTPEAVVLIVCAELCTLHLQKQATPDNLASALLFGDGAAAVILTGENVPGKGLLLKHFYSGVATEGNADMAWSISSSGFQMTLSNAIPDIIEAHILPLLLHAFKTQNITKEDINHWCIHPGGKRILEAIQKALKLSKEDLCHSYETLRRYGNMSSPTILFVMKNILPKLRNGERMLGVAFGPGLTMESFTAEARQ